MTPAIWFFLLTGLFFSPAVKADVAANCSEMQYWDISRQMCMPLPMAEMPTKMLMLHANIFGARVWEEGPRGRDAWAGPDMLMADAGTSVGDRQYLNLEWMGSFEKWSFPDRGYPLFGQIGEQDAAGAPFVDAQHPHSSPIMGLTLSDTLALDTGEKDRLTAFFAPRGESTDGPIPFMHRPTGRVNPDAPLGHHVGQDVGHISSTVIGAALSQGSMTYEISTYHGAEPSPESVDLPIGTPNSAGLRISRSFDPEFTAMASFAYVKAPEPSDPDIGYELRYSASAYHQLALSPHWNFDNALIFGAITGMDHASALYSFGEEFLFANGPSEFWGRVEVLQRTADELEIPATPLAARWIEAGTLGYTWSFAHFDEAQLGFGGSVTRTLFPDEFRGSYGGDPWSGKVFLELSGMKMWGM